MPLVSAENAIPMDFSDLAISPGFSADRVPLFSDTSRCNGPLLLWGIKCRPPEMNRHLAGIRPSLLTKGTPGLLSHQTPTRGTREAILGSFFLTVMFPKVRLGSKLTALMLHTSIAFLNVHRV